MTGPARIPTNLRTLLILEALSRSGRALSPTEIGREVGLPKPTAHRLCATLVVEGVLAPSGGGGGLRPGRRARDMARGLLHASGDAQARRQVLTQVAAAVGETVNFAAPADEGMTYVDLVETDWAFRIQLPIGAVVPFHRTASGKTWLASLPLARRKRMAAAFDYSGGGPNAHRDAAALLADLAEIGRRGYALDREELLEGMVALAVPIQDVGGDFVAALAFHGPTQRISIDDAVSRKELLQSTATRLSETLFFDL